MMMTMCLISLRACARSLVVGCTCRAGAWIEASGLAGGAVGEAEAVVGLSLLVLGTTAVAGRLVAVLQAERARIESNRTE